MTHAALPNLDPLVASLLARAPRMNFMQLCRLLEVRVPAQPGFGTQDAPDHEPVRFRPRPRLGFPASEVAAVEFDDAWPDGPPTVRTTFMGLYGVDAAMPSHTIDEIALREEGHEAVEAFLDQFNHRYIALLYRAWRKYRYPEHFRPGGTDAHSRNLLCLAGFGWGDKPRRAGLPDSRMLALLGLLIQRTRTPEGLAGVVALAVPGIGVRVDEFWPVTTSSGRPRPLTSACAGLVQESGGRGGLGSGYVLGRRMSYRSRAVRATLQPADERQANGLLPGGALHRDLMAFVQLYVGVKADVHMRMEMSSRFAPCPTIGLRAADPAPRLGWTTVLPAAHERPINIALGRYTAFPTPEPNPYLSQHA
ncbi:type VI secretion system baseplate subunit TssG [Burkholderia sp. Ac-20379]|uniref:type VI secretion system baseplate subunit TssG n=1 Tax=Burkholderia sp. Ac-20379 TaxID=2703900 RepID=UPI0019819589|nr:type VI secretion system baseplate subunit TssG [Burkholderia sp. Ac-20379]MBN3722704.1 type VI secretion system baseplate subunit TssG [Burkholderia sp. Ac-20379]